MDFQIIEQFNTFWHYYQVDEKLFPHRRAATLRLWMDRTAHEREAMIAEVKSKGGPKGKNPYFYVQEFAKAEPENLNRTARGGAMMNNGTAEIAFFNGSWGVYSHKDIRDFNLLTKKEYERQQEK